MIWKIKVYSKWLIFIGIIFLCLFVLLSLLAIPTSHPLHYLVGTILSILLIYLSIKTLDIVVNPVFLRLDDEGVYLRGKIFIPYEGIFAFTKEKRLILTATGYGGYIEIYRLILHPSEALSLSGILFKTKFFIIPSRDRNGVICVTFPSSYKTDPHYEKVLGEMFEKYRNKTGNLLSSNYYPDLYKERKI